MRIKILSDSTCDLSQELLAQHDITLVPLTVIKADEEFKDGVTITPQVMWQTVAPCVPPLPTALANMRNGSKNSPGSMTVLSISISAPASPVVIKTPVSLLKISPMFGLSIP